VRDACSTRTVSYGSVVCYVRASKLDRRRQKWRYPRRADLIGCRSSEKPQASEASSDPSQRQGTRFQSRCRLLGLIRTVRASAGLHRTRDRRAAWPGVVTGCIISGEGHSLRQVKVFTIKHLQIHDCQVGNESCELHSFRNKSDLVLTFSASIWRSRTLGILGRRLIRGSHSFHFAAS